MAPEDQARMFVVAVAVGLIAVALLAFVARPGYGVAPRIFFALAMAFALVAATIDNRAAALIPALFLIVLGGITTIVDRRRIRLED